MHSEPGELTRLNEAVGSVKLNKATDEEINQTLRYCMLLVGIRAQNLPAGEEILVIKNFIKQYLGKYSLGEYRLAFELNVAGQLECDPKAYENFNSFYISTVMKAYRKYANGILEFAERRMKPEQKALPPANYSPLELLNVYYGDFLKGELNWKTVTDKAYDIAFNNCEMKFSEDDLMKCIEEAKKEVLLDYVETKTRDEIRALKDIPVGEVCKNDDVNHVAKLNCLKLWFSRLKKDHVKVITKYKQPGKFIK
jgi:hypothetical protein